MNKTEILNGSLLPLLLSLTDDINDTASAEYFGRAISEIHTRCTFLIRTERELVENYVNAAILWQTNKNPVTKNKLSELTLEIVRTCRRQG